MVHFIKDGYKSEGIWCRVEDTNHKKLRIVGQMLNEPYSPFGVHEGDKIEFILYNGHGGDVVAIAMLDEN